MGAAWGQHAQHVCLPACLFTLARRAPCVAFLGASLTHRLMMASGIRRQRLSSREAAIKALLDEFAAACAQVRRRRRRWLWRRRVSGATF